MYLKFRFDIQWKWYDSWNSIQILTRDTHKIRINVYVSNCQWTDDDLTAVCRIWYTLVVHAILQIRPKIEIRLHFGRSRIWAGFAKMAGFWPKPDPKSGTALLLANLYCLLPDYSRQFLLQTDASDQGIGAVLLQEKDPTGLASRKLLRYHWARMSCHCMGICKFDNFQYGHHFLLEVDHEPLKYLNECNFKNGLLTRWTFSIQPYRFMVRHIKGFLNVGADILSRHCVDWWVCLWLTSQCLEHHHSSWNKCITYV